MVDFEFSESHWHVMHIGLITFKQEILLCWYFWYVIVDCWGNRTKDWPFPCRISTNRQALFNSVLLYCWFAKYWSHVPIFSHLVCQPICSFYPGQVCVIYFLCILFFLSFMKDLL